MHAMALQFAKSQLASNMRRWDEEEHFPADTVRKAATLGFSGTALSADRRNACQAGRWRKRTDAARCLHCL